MSEEPHVLFEQRGRVGLITLNRPKALNALTHGMALSMQGRLDAWKTDASISAVVIRGAGERAFCAGGDIRSLYESGLAKTPYALNFYRDEYILDATIKHYPKPYVALIHGIDMGGGVGVSVNGSLRIASEGIVFAMPETGIGLFPDVGGSYFLPRCPGETGMYLALTGARLKLEDSLYAGVANGFLPLAHHDALIERMSKGEKAEDVLHSFAGGTGPAPLATLRPTIDRIFSASSVEGILERLDREGSDWASATASTIRTKSPTSLKVAYRQIREGAKLSFDECMRMEYRMVHRVVAGHDFYEGVRATIIDKDGAPKWKPVELAAVKDEDVDAYFAPLGEKELKL